MGRRAHPTGEANRRAHEAAPFSPQSSAWSGFVPPSRGQQRCLARDWPELVEGDAGGAVAAEGGIQASLVQPWQSPARKRSSIDTAQLQQLTNLWIQDNSSRPLQQSACIHPPLQDTYFHPENPKFPWRRNPVFQNRQSIGTTS